MSDKKQNIMDTAVKFFAEKGYHATSIQDIADELGIAKGAMYFYFKSKEDLLVQIVQHYLTLFANEFIAIMRDEERSPRARLAKQIILKSERLSDNRDFITMFIKERFEVNEAIHTLLHDVNAQFLEVTMECIVALYGERIKRYAKDAAILFTSMVDGYLGVLHVEHANINLGKLSHFLVDRLDDVVEGLLEERPDPIMDF